MHDLYQMPMGVIPAGTHACQEDRPYPLISMTDDAGSSCYEALANVPSYGMPRDDCGFSVLRAHRNRIPHWWYALRCSRGKRNRYFLAQTYEDAITAGRQFCAGGQFPDAGPLPEEIKPEFDSALISFIPLIPVEDRWGEGKGIQSKWEPINTSQ